MERNPYPSDLTDEQWSLIESHIPPEKTGGRPVPQGFCYNSGTNDRFLSVGELRGLIAQHLESAPPASQAGDPGRSSRSPIPMFPKLATVA